jgi:hypothetical protein
MRRTPQLTVSIEGVTVPITFNQKLRVDGTRMDIAGIYTFLQTARYHPKSDLLLRMQYHEL